VTVRFKEFKRRDNVYLSVVEDEDTKAELGTHSSSILLYFVLTWTRYQSSLILTLRHH